MCMLDDILVPQSGRPHTVRSISLSNLVNVHNFPVEIIHKNFKYVK